MLDVIFAFLSLAFLLSSVFFLYRARKSYRDASILNKNLKNQYSAMISRSVRVNSVRATDLMEHISGYAVEVNKSNFHVMDNAFYDDAEIINSKNDLMKFHRKDNVSRDDSFEKSIFLKNQYEI